MITPTALGAITVDMNGRVIYQKDPDTPYNLMSLAKCMTGYLVYKHQIAHDMLVTVNESELASGTSMSLQAGDIVSVRDLLYGLMLPSGNDAGRVLARLVGQKLLDQEGGSGDPRARHVQEMNTQGEEWGWGQGFVFVGPSGYPNMNNRVTARQVADLWRRSVTDYPDFSDISGARSHQATITGPNARTLDLSHTIQTDDDPAFPEYVSGKTGGRTGTTAPARSAVFYWRDSGTDTGYISVVLATPEVDPARYVEMRAMMDHTMSAPEPIGGGFTIGGKTPTSMSAGGKPVIAVKRGGNTVWP